MDTPQHRRARAVAWALVALQVLLLAALALLPPQSGWTDTPLLVIPGALLVVLGGLLALAGAIGLGPALTPSPVPNTVGQLRTTGIYACVRHPIYTGLITAGTGALLALGGLTRLLAWVLLIGLLAGKARWEEHLLRQRFPTYADYAASTPRLLPRPLHCLHRLRGHISQS